MTIDVGYCGLEDDLSKAAAIMWEHDCGIVPIVDDEYRVVGVVTDRDIAIAAASRNRRPSEIQVREMLFNPIETCSMEDSVADVLKRMGELKIRRLPVAGGRGELLGIISVADVLKKGRKKDVKAALKALRKIAGRLSCREIPEPEKSVET